MARDFLDGRGEIAEFIKKGLEQLGENFLTLDAGAGDPEFQVRVPGGRYVSVDLGVGDKNWNYSKIDVIGNLEALPMLDDSFDCVICSQVLEHMSEPEQVLRELHRTLKPGGKILLSAPQEWYMHQIPYDFYRFTRYGLEHLFNKVGFQIESIESIGGYFRLLSFNLCYLKYFIFPPIKSLPLKIIRWPLRYPFTLVFEFIIPFFLGILDRFDKNRYHTMNYAVIAIKKQ